MKIGAFVGKFYPPHIGHLSVIDKAQKDLDEVWVIISKNKQREQEIKQKDNFEISSELIKSWFKEYYKDNKKIKVAVFDESGLAPYPADQEQWAERFRKQFPSINVKIADGGYREFNEKYFPEYEFYEIDREQIPIHSTLFRQEPNKYLEYLIPQAQKYFKEKING